jgi:hypothetical protein
MAMNQRLMRPRASGDFSPPQIQGNALWLDFSDQSVMGTTNTAVGTVANNSLVGFVRDKSPLGNNVASVINSDSVKPRLLLSSINGRSCLSFDGGDSLDRAHSGLMTPPFTLFAVGIATTTGSTRLCGVSSARSIGPFANSNANWGFFQGNGNVVSFGASATSVAVLCMSVNASSVGIFYANGNQAATATLNAATPNLFQVGSDGGGGGTYNGRACELVGYSRVISDAERIAVTRWLGRRWGVTVA